jgi:5,10-methylenetetrahydromethanopterin reductase
MPCGEHRAGTIRAAGVPSVTATAAPRTGIWFFPDHPAGQLVDAIAHAEAVGLDEVWLGDEGPAREPFAVLAAAATRTTTIGLAIGVTNPYVRHPALATASMATISELAGGRSVLGVGAGGAMSLGPFELAAERPVAAVERFLRIARAGRDGSPTDGYVPSDLAVAAAAPAVPVFVGARGPRLNRLASETADGAFVAGMPPFRYDEVIGWARSVRPIEIALYPSVAFDDAAIERHRPESIWALLDTPREVCERLGIDVDDVARAADALRGGDPRPACELVDDDVLAQLMLLGAPDVVGRRLAELVRRHEPSSIGLAVIAPELRSTIDDVARAFAAMRHHLGED